MVESTEAGNQIEGEEAKNLVTTLQRIGRNLPAVPEG